MRAVFKLLLPVFIFVQIVLPAMAEQPIRSVSPEKLQKDLNDKDSIYEKNYVAKTNLWDKIWGWIIRHLFRPLFKHHDLTIWDIILYAIAATALVLIVYYFIKSDKVSLFSRKAKEVSLG